MFEEIDGRRFQPVDRPSALNLDGVDRPAPDPLRGLEGLTSDSFDGVGRSRRDGSRVAGRAPSMAFAGCESIG
jgi:hypothetical protein